jgi:hypothetical protein
MSGIRRPLPGLLVVLALSACTLVPGLVTAQALTGALIGTVRDSQGLAISGVSVRLTSPAVIGLATDNRFASNFA